MADKDKKSNSLPSPFQKVMPKGIKAGRDQLMLRLDFYKEVIVMQEVDKSGGSVRLVSAHDIAQAMTGELTFSTGMLPENTLWWSNTRSGPVFAIFVEAGTRRLALQTAAGKPPERYDVPLPALIFICQPGRPPSVFAVSKRPSGLKEKVYHAPFPNMYNDGRTCGGSHGYPADPGDVPDSFFKSFFSPDLRAGWSKKYPGNITNLWEEIDGKDKYPLNDLVYWGTVADLMRI